MKLLEDLGMIYPTEKSKRKYRFGLYECPQCAMIFKMQTRSIEYNKTKKCVSCSNKTHGDSNSKLYNVWINMKNRCKHNPIYIKQNIKVCMLWENNYEEFKKWSLANGYLDGLELDKDILCKEKNIYPKIYSPETCQFVTKKINLSCVARGNAIRKSKISRDDSKKIRELYQQGLLQKEIAIIFGVSRSLISHILNERILNFN